MLIKNQIFLLLMATLSLTACSKYKDPAALIEEYENSRIDQIFATAIAEAEIISNQKSEHVDLITFYDEPVPPHFYDLHVNNGFDMANAKIGSSPIRTLPTVETKVDLPEGATRTDVKLNLEYVVDPHDH